MWFIAAVRDCMDVMHLGYRESGVYDVSLDGLNISSVYCDMDTAGGGWTVSNIRNRSSGSANREAANGSTIRDGTTIMNR